MRRGLNSLLRALCAATLAAGVLAFAPRSIFAESSFLVDSPATGILNYSTYNLSFRSFSGGGVLSRLNFGVFKTVNVGFSWEVSNVVGSENITVGPPALYLKIKPYAGGMTLPALAFGYDGQGYFYSKDKTEFLQKERGLFVVIGRETLIPGLVMNLGGNISDFRTNVVSGFANASFNFEDKVFVLAEYDNIHNGQDNRFNAGLRFFVLDELSIDLSGRDIGAAGRSAERVIQINYTGKF